MSGSKTSEKKSRGSLSHKKRTKRLLTLIVALVMAYIVRAFMSRELTVQQVLDLITVDTPHLSDP